MADSPAVVQRRVVLRVFQVLFTICTIGTVVFIFSNSLQIAQLSGMRSQSVMRILNRIMEMLGFSYRFTEHIVRKLAHFSEYALLGFWLMLTLRVYTKRIFAHIFFPLFMGLAAAVCDENLQVYVSGRSGEVRDVLIDFGGVLTGVFCGLCFLLVAKLIYYLFRHSLE